jgi:nucleoside-diphosphate-sugar epimerase
MNAVLVTGGLGNIGVKVIDELILRGYRVRCLDLATKANRKKARRYRGRIEMAWCDITNPDDLLSAVQGVNAVIHTAAILPPFSEKNPEFARRVNVDGTRNIVKALAKVNPDAQFVFSSSVSVHGNHLPDHKPGRNVDDPFNPVDHYSEHKIECERMLEKSELAWSILRVSACVDEKARMLSLANLRGSLETFFSVHPMCRVEYVHPADVAVSMVNAVGNAQAIGKRFFIGGGIACRSYWRDLNSIRLESLGLAKPPTECFGNAGFYTEWLDTDEAQQILDYQNHDLEDYRQELMDMLKWPRRLLTVIPASAKVAIWKLVPCITVDQGNSGKS